MKTAIFQKTEIEEIEKESDKINTKINNVKEQLMNLRKTGYDTLIADITIKPVKSKLAYYKATKDDKTLENIRKILADAETEIIDIKKQVLTTAKDEMEQKLKEIKQKETGQVTEK